MQTSKKNLYIPWGDDYEFQEGYSNFHEIDLLIKYGNKLNTANIEFVYSTPSKFIKALHEEKLSYPIKSNDFWSVEDGDNS